MRVVREFRLESLLFAAFFSTLPLYSPNLVMFNDLFPASGEVMPWFVNAMMLSAVVTGLFVAVASLRSGGAVFVGFPAVSAAAAFYVGGFVLFALALAVPGFGVGVVAFVAGLAVAVGVVPLCLAWGTYFSALDMRQALFSLAVLVGMGSLAELLLSAVSMQVGLVAFALLLVLGVLLPLWKALRGELSRTVRDAAEGEAFVSDPLASELVASVDGAVGLLSSARRMASVLAMPLVGLLMFGFLMGVRKFMLFDLIYVEALGGIVAAVVVLPLSLAEMRCPLLPLVYQVVLPLFALALVVLNSFPVGTGPQWLAASVSYVFYGVIGILALASLCAMAHAREFSAPLIYGLVVAAFALVSLAGIWCGSLPLFAYQQGGPVLLVLSTAYFALLVGVPLVAAWRREVALPVDDACAPVEGVGVLQERCERLSREGGLSPRESEILAYLGRGHGIAYVAKTLVISESTVRTHVKSIYRKLGVSSREELLQRVDEG
ncbi:helix-turn-helix transcriptional regulator [Gordonibacter sp. An230]|uniref:helix-turn-helix transcriptional regulator n=1 Tax=Gordonibacter sp. An230 TaxID=1965592 RepID=UPI0013A659B4|nr:helix-turn-helix transcriptional regulator [Gordonibacter sp. An230]